MKSHAILRTNTGLTTNVKLVVRSNYELYLDCIDSSPELNSVRYRKQRFTKDNYWDEIVPRFFLNTPPQVAYKVKYDNDNSTMFDDFSKQYDDLYFFGARNIYDNKDYEEEFEYFAPLHVSKSKLPSKFIIFRIDGPGLLELTKDNFRSEYLERMKVVKLFDLTANTELGEFLKKNITDNNAFPVTSLDIDFKKLEFSYLIGVDYGTGGYTRRSMMLEDMFSKEMSFSDMSKFFYNNYRDNQIIYPHIINFSFLFDDTPATATQLRKWSINRYCGFYIDSMELVVTISPNDLPELKSNAVIAKGNVLTTTDFGNPFVDETKVGDFPYVEVDGRFYSIQKYIEYGEEERVKVQISPYTFVDRLVRAESTNYKVLSNISLEGKTNLNVNLVYLESDVNGRTYIYNKDLTPFVINDFEDVDIWIIQIDDSYHKLIKNSSGLIEIVTDYAFSQSADSLQYYINESDSRYRKKLNLSVSAFQGPREFKIFKCELSDIKDFDTDIVDTNFAKYEYEYKEYLTETDEPKFILSNLNSTSNPKDLDDYLIGTEVVNVPVASEYTLNHETFRLVEDDLNDLWRKNPLSIKWGFQNSLSDGDYPYLLNNNYLADDYNKTVNPYTREVKRFEKNLDYFYSVNPDTSEFLHQTLHIQPTSGGLINAGLNFEPFKYIDTSLDYFTYFFGQRSFFDSGNLVKNTKKWSNFNSSDGLITNSTLFRGLKFNIHEVAGISINGNSVENMNLKLTNEFEDYKFSILVSENTQRITYDLSNLNKGITESFYNNQAWITIDEWKMDKVYNTYDHVLYQNELLYSLIDNNIITDPSKSPTLDSWKQVFELMEATDFDGIGNLIYVGQPTRTIFDATLKNETFFLTQYGRGSLYLSGDGVTLNGDNLPNVEDEFAGPLHPIIYYRGEFYYIALQSNRGVFWKQYNNYVLDDYVIYEGKIWKCELANKNKPPGGWERFSDIDPVSNQVTYRDYWITDPNFDINNLVFFQNKLNLLKVELWDSKKTYLRFSGVFNYSGFQMIYVLHKDILWAYYDNTRDLPVGIEPGIDPRWKRIYSMVPDPNFVYGGTASANNVIEMNNRFYMYIERPLPPLSTDQKLDNTLDNGITIYINKKFKNILINIYINDNTYKKFKKVIKEGPLNISDNLPLNYKYDVDSLGSFIDDIRDNLYTDVFEKLSANNLMNAMNDLNNKYGFVNAIKYVVVETTGELKIYDFDNLESVKTLPYFISCEGPDEFYVKNNSSKKESVNVDENILKPKFKLQNGYLKSLDELNYAADTPVANTIFDEKVEQNLVPNFGSLKNNVYTQMYRHSGFYSPVFKNIELFSAYTESKNLGNFKFDTTLTEFGMTGERIVSKVNRKKNVLKLSNLSNQKSIYPALDEFGYQIVKTFIFKSTWDFKYHYECKLPDSITQKTNKVLTRTNPNFPKINTL